MRNFCCVNFLKKLFTWCVKQKKWIHSVVGVFPKALWRINFLFCREQKYSDCTFFYRHFAVEWILSFARLLIPLLCVRSQVTEVYDEIFPLLLANKKNNFYHDMLNCLSFIVNVKAMLCCASNIHRNHSTMRGFFFLLYATIKWCIIIIIFYFMSSDNKTLRVEEKNDLFSWKRKHPRRNV